MADPVVRVLQFEGPLDLLLHLIEKNKVNIYDIPINYYEQKIDEIILKQFGLDQINIPTSSEPNKQVTTITKTEQKIEKIKKFNDKRVNIKKSNRIRNRRKAN